MSEADQQNRDAYGAIAGFVFQVNSTILHWLQLRPDESLELEAGEDIDIVRGEASQGEIELSRLLMQLKQIADGSLTLRNIHARKSVANFCGHLNADHDGKLQFRFVTTLKIGEERKDWTFSHSAIRTWERIRCDEASAEERVAGLDALRAFLKSCGRPDGFSSDTWSCLEALLADPDSTGFAALVANFEWSAESKNYQEIKEQACALLLELVPELSPEAAARMFEHLFICVFEVLSQPGAKRLDPAMLKEKLRSAYVSAQSRAAVNRINLQLELLQRRVAVLEARVDSHESTLGTMGEDLKALQETVAQDQEGALKTFYSVDDYFASGHQGIAFYDLDQQLQGRRQVRDELDQFLGSVDRWIALVEGSGGIGKTKLLRDWSRNQPGWTTLWTGPDLGVWHTGTTNEVPEGNTLIVVDDAHRYDDLERLTTLIATWPLPGRVKLVISARRSENSNVRQALVRIDENAILRLPPLQPLSHDEVVALALEVLGSDHGEYAGRLAWASHDSPFITVVGGKLIARGQIALTPELLNNDREFQAKVFDSLASQFDGDLPSGKRTKRQFMEFIAALQPVKESDDSFIEKAAEFLGLKNSEVRRGFGSLEANGVLRRRRRGSSVAPDLLADYLLGIASVEENGQPTEFADEVFEAFQTSQLSNLLKNLGLLDWRIAHRDGDSRLLDRIWARLSERFRQENANERLRTLRAVESVAVYQPTRVHSLVQIAMDVPARTATYYHISRTTQERVLERLPAFLGVTILNEATAGDAFERLWQLTQSRHENVRNQAQRALQAAIGYGKYKNLALNDRVLRIAETYAIDPRNYEGKFTPLDILDQLMVREIDHTEQVGMAFHNSILTILYESVQGLRERVFRTLEICLASENPRIVCRAVRSLGKIIGIFIPMRRERESEEERIWHVAERQRGLDMLERRLGSGNLPLAALWKIRRILQSASEEARQSQEVREGATRILSSAASPEFLDVFHVLCTRQWGYNTEEDGFVSVSDRRRTEESGAIASIRAQYPNPPDQVHVVESVVLAARDADIEPKEIDSFLSLMCAEPQFLRAFSDHLLNEETSVLRQVAGIATRAWHATDLSEFLRYARAFVNSLNRRMVFSVAQEISSGPALPHTTSEDVEVLTILASRSEPGILGTIFPALGQLSRPGRYPERARQLIRVVDIGKDPDLAEAYCRIVGEGPFAVSAASLDTETIDSMLGKLVPVYEIEGHTFGDFFSRISGRTPLGIVGLLEHRLDLAAAAVPDDQEPLYKPVPSVGLWSSLSAARETADYEETLRRLFDLGIRFPDFEPYLDQIFWRFGTLDETTFGVLDQGLHADDDDRLRRSIRLLCDAPKGIPFSHPMFAMHVLTVCEARSAESGNTAMSLLVSNAVSPGGFQTVGPYAAPIGDGVADRARIAMELCEVGSPLHRLYSRLAEVTPIPIPDFAAELAAEEDDS